MMLGNIDQKNENSSQAKHQGRALLLFLDHNFKGYKTSKWFQRETSVQVTGRRVNSTNKNNTIRDKAKALIIQLQDDHGKENFIIFMEQK
eukprot:5901273-Ditylum_brightwellii.AAC.1